MIKLLVVDDSALMRRLLSDLFQAEPDFVVELARSGREALEKAEIFSPDVVTLDVTMSDMDGLTCLDQIMLHSPRPVVMISALTADGAQETLKALALGAVDFIAKPQGAISLVMEEFGPQVVAKVRTAAAARIPGTTRLRERIQARTAKARSMSPVVARRAVRACPSSEPPPIFADGGLVLVGTSTGGPPALDALLTGLPRDFPWPIVIAQHMPASFTGPLARRLDGICPLTVREVTGSVVLEPGHAYVASGGGDIIVTRRGARLVVRSAPSSKSHTWHPSVDRLVESALRVAAPAQMIGILMTGMGDDGAEAMAELRKRGGYTIAEAEETAIVWGMPGALVDRDGASAVVALDALAGHVLERLMP